MVGTNKKSFAPAASIAGSDAISKDDAAIKGWASDFVKPVKFGLNVDEIWQTPEKALGPAEGNATDVVSLGEGGEIVLVFDPPVSDGEGFDIAVFENSFSDNFLELAFVEVSSDGVTFSRFDSWYLGTEPVGEYGTLKPEDIGGLAGKYRQGYGTPFDLAELKEKPEVVSGAVDLQQIKFVKIIDITGDGSLTDSHGNKIYDPYPTKESAGFDLDAAAALNN